MAIICPTVTAYDLPTYGDQLQRISGFSERIHVDLMDGEFAPTRSPALSDIWLPPTINCDIHLMYQRPMEYLRQLVALRPSLVVVPVEADVHHMHFAAALHQEGIKAGLAILQDTPVSNAYQIMHSFDHVLVFSGRLGYHGGVAKLELLDKVTMIREHHPEAEISWDGGINADNAGQLAAAGVNVLNTGGYIQKAINPEAAYATLKAIIE